ncbi:hypothetical protein DM01DRAFT_1338981 [Hesseltinella vesiculosa]|uniref:Peptidase S8/S53 domain-containing protein n=1 Tax=Hesseltinella vesiculosa TaxID=101127 RepID=A0A1X2G8I1_9FUNG|nr:hypothetical protein DM01DRAFT_1338981 [Hesseltinella vesiculosa]
MTPTSSIQTSSIGGFHWYTGPFPPHNFESLFSDLEYQPSSTRLNDHPVLQYWVKDTTFSLQEMVQESPSSWGLDRIDQRSGTDGLYRFMNNQGAGATVYVLDTGVTPDNEDLVGRVQIGQTIVGDDPSDTDGHGTFVAGVCCGSTYGVAKLANIVSVKILDSDGNGRLSDLLLGLEWVAQQHINTTFTSAPSSAPSSLPLSTSNTPPRTSPSASTNATVPSNHTTAAKPTGSHVGTKSTTQQETTVHAAYANLIVSDFIAQPSHVPSKKHSNGTVTSSPSVAAGATSAASASITGSPAPAAQQVPMTKSIVNLSLGALYSQACNDAIEQILRLGIHVTVAAGNYGEDACMYSPGSTPGAVTVGATNQDDSIAYYSNFGTCVDIFAPGTSITSTSPSNSSTTRSGTSMAAPHVAGAMALFLTDNDYTPPQLAYHLQSVSSLISLDFAINNTDNNPNKTVLDNGVGTGVQVPVDYQQQYNTFINVLYTSPNDSQPVWIYGDQLPNAASALPLSLYPVLVLVCTSFLYQ